MADVTVADHAGACYGVERALEMTLRTAETASGPVRTLGPLIHNPRVVADLESRGVVVASRPGDAPDGTLIIRAHGVPPRVMEEARGSGVEVVDATCPYVKRVHHAAERMVAQGLQVVVVGESGHPEVEGILGHAGPDAIVASGPGDLEGVALARRVGVVVQTTQTSAALSSVVAAIAPRVDELHVSNTICAATSERQQSALRLAERSDCMVVVGGRASGNTRRLAEICAEACANTHHIESAAEIDPVWLDGAAAIGVTAGASTPSAHIDEVVARIREVTS